MELDCAHGIVTGMDVLVVRLTDPAVTALLNGLWTEYATRYGAADARGVMADATATQFDPPDGAFVVLVEDGRTVAGGGFRRVDAFSGEIKRMWTSPTHRRRGHATTVLHALERLAQQQGFSRMLLETGPAQPEAIELYAAARYARIDVYGDYEQAVAYARDLTTTRSSDRPHEGAST